MTVTATVTAATTATPSVPPVATTGESAPSSTPSVPLARLHDELKAVLDRPPVPGKYAVAVTDLQTGETVSVNGDRPHLAGCMINLFVLMAAVQEVAQGHRSEAEVGELIAATTWSSNPTSAKEIVLLLGDGDGAAGMRVVVDYIASLGLGEDVVLDHPPLYREFSIGRDWNNWVTAEATNEALALLWHGSAVAEPWHGYLLDHLKTVKPGLNYLVASVPARVSHKNGFFEGTTGFVDNDTGIVVLTADEGREYAYAVTFLAEEVQVKYADVPLGQQLMRAIHAYFTAQYQ